MKVLITGAYGFIGSHVCREFLRNGHDVIGIDAVSYAADPKRIVDLDIKVFEDDICNESNLDSIVRSNEIEWIVNTAAETHVDNSIRSSKEFIKSNIEGVRSILDVCRNTGTKLLQFSTDEVYGVPDGTPFNELSPLSPRNPYSSTKAAAEMLLIEDQETQALRAEYGHVQYPEDVKEKIDLREFRSEFKHLSPTLFPGTEDDAETEVLHGQDEEVPEFKREYGLPIPGFSFEGEDNRLNSQKFETEH